MNVANHTQRSDRLSVPNTHCVPRRVEGGRKPPQRATGPADAAGIQLSSSEQIVSGNRTHWEDFPFEFLLERIVQDQHDNIRRALLDLQDLSAAAVKYEPASHTDLRAVRQLVGQLATGLAGHMNEEERIFRQLMQLELAYLGEGPIPTSATTARKALQTFSNDHTAHLHGLDQLCRRADSIATRPGTTAAERDLCTRLKALQTVLRNHCYLERNVIFARAAQMETQVFGGTAGSAASEL